MDESPSYLRGLWGQKKINQPLKPTKSNVLGKANSKRATNLSKTVGPIEGQTKQSYINKKQKLKIKKSICEMCGRRIPKFKSGSESESNRRCKQCINY